MNCPKCNSDNVFTPDSRPRGNTVYRRRSCEGCGYRWSTLEISHEEYLGLQEAKRLLEKMKHILMEETTDD
jgi:transcriptional regulator NrdR family protein